MRAVCVSDLRRLNLLALDDSTRGDLLGTAERIRTNEAQDVKACVLTMCFLRVFAAKQGNALVQGLRCHAREIRRRYE